MKGDLGVFDFTEEDEVNEPSYHNWSKLPNPNLDFHDYNDDPITKYQFLQHASSGSVSVMKEVSTEERIHVDTDDDDHVFVDDISHGPLDSPDKAVTKKLDGFVSTSERVLERPYSCNEDSVKLKDSTSFMGIRDSTIGLSTGNGHISPMIPESPCCNGTADVGISDVHDSIQEESPLTSASELEEKDVSIGGQAQDRSVCGFELGEEDDTVIIHTDYVAYGEKYFPTFLILISRDTVKMKPSASEVESPGSRSEWKLDDIVRIECQWIHTAKVANVKIQLLTKDAVQVENVNGTEGVEVLEFLVHDPYWSLTQEHIKSLDLRYKAVWTSNLNDNRDGDLYPSEDGECSSDPYIPIFEEPFEEVVYPKGDADPVSIGKRDVDLLQPETFLNDTIIDFYIKYLSSAIPSEERHRFYFFNSFFFRKLADPDKNPSSLSDGKAAFQRVRKWTRKVNIFEKDYIFIPVNYSLHWSLIVICHPGEVTNYNDEKIIEASRVPCILHMDSIRGTHAGLKDLIQSYLFEEWKERKKETSEDISSKFLNLRFLSLELPQQENCFDCGLFLLHFVELFIAEAPANFSPFLINKFESFLRPDWFMPGEASTKRVYIQKLIYELLKSHSSDCASPSCDRLSHPLSSQEKNEKDNGIEIISEKRSPGKSWNGDSLYPEPGQGMGFDMLYNTSNCTSGLGMTELLGHCQNFDRGLSFEPLGLPLSTIREEEGDDHLEHSTFSQTGLQPTDRLAAGSCHVGYASEDLDQGFQWNSELSDQGDPESNSSPMSHYSSDESEDMRIIESNMGSHAVDFVQNENLDQAKENVDSLTDSYASASSDMMETPAEDSQELAKMHGSNDLEAPLLSNQDAVMEPSEQAKMHGGNVLEDPLLTNQDVMEPSVKNPDNIIDAEDIQELAKMQGSNGLKDILVSNQEEVIESSEKEPDNIIDDGMADVSEELVVEDSSSEADEEQPSKRMRLTTPCDDEREPPL